MKKILSGLILLLCCPYGFAANGDGATHMSNLSFGPLTVAAANNSGYNIFEALSNTTGTYPVRCHCDDTHGGPGQQTAFFLSSTREMPHRGLCLSALLMG